MDDATHSNADAGTVGIATLDGKMEDFGLVDYEPPVSDTHSSVEPPDSAPANEAGDDNSADGLIDYQESDYYDESDAGAEFVDTEEGYSAESRAEETGDSHLVSATTIAAASAAAAAAFASASLEQSTTASVAQNEQYYDADDVMIISDEEEEEEEGEGAVAASAQEHLSDAQPDAGEGTEGENNFYGIDEQQQQQQWQEAGIDGGAGVPETWVYSEGEWVVYLGPEQRSYTAEFQTGLFALSLSELMDVLHGDFVVDTSMELALEFPSLGVVIDQRDDESRQLSLKQLYMCHVAAVAMGRLPLDYASSPYYSSSSLQGAFFCPSPEAFSFVIRTRPKLSYTILRIMQTASDHAEQQQQQPQNVSGASETDHPQTEEQHVVVDEEDGEEPEAVGNGHVAADDDDDQASAEGVANGEEPDEADEEEEADTAQLVEDDEEDEDEDEDFEPEDEEKEDHVLDPDAVDEEEEEEEPANGELEEGTSASHKEEEAEAPAEEPLEEEDGVKTRVDSQNASPTNKRTKEQQLGADAKNVVEGEEEPASKKAKSDDELETDQQPVAT
ncbi:hypothetical protein H4R20_001280 [Coemansia guatemalensis]|uniref:Uncharacterized protein n=1 Tax=Coemansia guatemalensis TaxID=2761395 RepID=A0A9W8I3N4_9FUNG|nr:hypothetical protein H4R20_001280 [Coemansia guatemalensis]